MEQQLTESKAYFEVTKNVWGIKDVFVNIYMIKSNESDEWFFIDAGLKTSVARIQNTAVSLFGDKKPQCIILTHGHFDHVGSIQALIEEWKVPVYAHYLELPYLTNKSSYPPTDPTVGGGMMAYMAFLYPTSPINLGAHVSALPEDNAIPGFKEWRYIHTPGHTFGHISLFRDEDKVLVAGDAFITTKGESALQAVILQSKIVSRPPAYFTPDWIAAYESVKQLYFLSPDIVATGHGKPMKGDEMLKQLHYLVDNFYQEFVPKQGRYAFEAPAADASGVLYVPPAVPNKFLKWFVISGFAIVTVLVLSGLFPKKGKKIKA